VSLTEAGSDQLEANLHAQAPVLGPILGGYISLKASWRWTFGLVGILVRSEASQSKRQ